ncbi:MAG: orotate phosphoribosyltransferase, partial [Bacteroidota bacterium]
MEKTDINISQLLLQIKAIKLDPANPFKWASGILSPIYCDHRKTLSYPSVRKEIKHAFIDKVESLYPNANTIAGVATGAIAHGAMVADEMDKPFVYIRSSAKQHGMENL